MTPPADLSDPQAAQSFVAARHHFLASVTAPRKPSSPAWLDRLGALVLLVLLAPVLATVALLIWRCDGAPVLFGHYRIGRDGRLFRCLKFRSMYRDSDRMLKQLLDRDPAAHEEWLRDHKLANDPRVTPVGNFLRRTSLDELPQLINVLRGDMGLVGPRPITVAELPRYGDVRWHYLSTRPGMTGLWQVSGRNDVTYEERVELDRRYVEGESWRMRLAILWRTVAVVMHGSGAR